MLRLLSLLFCAALATSAGAAADIRWTRLSSLPDAEGLAGAFAGTSGGAVLVAGGANFPEKKPWDGGQKRFHDTVYVLDKPDGQWRVAGRLPTRLAYGVSVSAMGALVCIGGSDGERHYSSVRVLRWRDQRLEFSSLPPLPQPCANMAGVLISNTIYVAGGSTSPNATNALCTLWSLDLATTNTQWRQLDPWSGPARILPAFGVCAGRFYVFSGADLHPAPDGKPARTYLRDAFAYSPHQGWKRLPDLPRAAVGGPSPAPIVGDCLLLISGDDGANTTFQPVAKHPGFPRSTLAFNPVVSTWTTLPDAPFSRATAPVVSWQKQSLMISGEVRPGIRSPEVWALPVD